MPNCLFSHTHASVSVPPCGVLLRALKIYVLQCILSCMFDGMKSTVPAVVSHCRFSYIDANRAILYSLAKQGKALGAQKMAHHAYGQLQKLRVPFRFQDTIDLGSIIIKSKPFQDPEVRSVLFVLFYFLMHA